MTEVEIPWNQTVMSRDLASPATSGKAPADLDSRDQEGTMEVTLISPGIRQETLRRTGTSSQTGSGRTEGIRASRTHLTPRLEGHSPAILSLS